MNTDNCPAKIYIIYSKVGKKRNSKVDTPLFVTFSCTKDKQELLYYFKHVVSARDSQTHRSVQREIKTRGVSKTYLRLAKYGTIPYSNPDTREQVRKIQDKLKTIVKYPI
jgi:hypothetical protein